MTEQDESDAKSGTQVQSLVRGLTVIRVFDAEHSRLTLSEVARRAGLTRATARRVLHTLVDLNYVATDGKNFSLRPKILELGYAYLSSMSLPTLVAPHLESLTAATQESSSVAILDGKDIVYVARVAKRRIMSVDIGVGTRLPAYATSMGRVLLAGCSSEELDSYLDQYEREKFTVRTLVDREALIDEIATVRQKGWAMVSEELEEGLRSLAVPIRSSAGHVLAALNLSASALRGEAEEIVENFLPKLLAAAKDIESDLVFVDR